MLPLRDVTVVSVEQAVAAPFASRQLADLGARVIKVERPEGDFARSYDQSVQGQSSYFVWLNRSKESIVLDLKAEAGQEHFEALLARADVYIHNLSPRAAARLGIDADTVFERYPSLVCCEISGYGDQTPWASRRAYDLLVQCETGLVSITGTEDTRAKVGISIADIAAGMYAFSGIVAALYDRATTGTGTVVSVSLFDSLMEWMSAPLYYTRYGGSAPKRLGLAHATIAPYGPFMTQNGHLVVIAVQNDREWQRFCRIVLGEPELAADPHFESNELRVRHRRLLDAHIARRIERAPADTVEHLLLEANIAYGHVNGLEGMLDHPALTNKWAAISIPGGTMDALVPPIRLAGRPLPVGPVPGLGQHTEVILEEFGLTEVPGGDA